MPRAQRSEDGVEFGRECRDGCSERIELARQRLSLDGGCQRVQSSRAEQGGAASDGMCDFAQRLAIAGLDHVDRLIDSRPIGGHEISDQLCEQRDVQRSARVADREDIARINRARFHAHLWMRCNRRAGRRHALMVGLSRESIVPRRTQTKMPRRPSRQSARPYPKRHTCYNQSRGSCFYRR
jgi:hypothetical protein